MDDDIIGSFFEELKELDANTSNINNDSNSNPIPTFSTAIDTHSIELSSSSTTSLGHTSSNAPAPVISTVISKPAEIVARPYQENVQAVYSYEYHGSSSGDPYGQDYASGSQYASSSSSSSSHQSSAPVALPQVPRQNKVFVRAAAGDVWVDDSLNDWPANDFRIFVGDLAKEVTTEHLAGHFQGYKSFAKAKVIRSKQDNKTKGYGFVSFMDPMDCAKAIREQNGKYLLSRPMKITKSDWNERSLKEVKKKEAKKRKLQESLGLV